MSYYPTSQEIEQLGFIPDWDEDEQMNVFTLNKTSAVSGRGGTIELVNDEGHAVLVEWLVGLHQEVGGLHAFTTCSCYEELENACNTAFDIIAEGR